MRQRDFPPPRPIVVVTGDYIYEWSRAIAASIAASVQRRGLSWLCMYEQRLGTEYPTRHPYPGIVAVIASDDRPPLLAALRRWRVPIVVCAHGWPASSHASVMADDHAVGRLGANYFINRGYINLAFVGEKLCYARERCEGFVEAATAHPGVRRPVVLEVDAMPTPEPLGAWLRQLPRPAAVMGCNDLYSLAAARSCVSVGLRIPDDVAILGVDNDLTATLLTAPGLSSIEQDFARIGDAAVACVVKLLADRTAPRPVIRVPPRGVVTRASTDVLVFDDANFSNAIRRIHKSVADGAPIDVKRLLDDVPVTRRWLERQFRNRLGRTPHDEIMRVRLTKACELLKTTDMPLKTIALRCGFGTNTHLCNAFRNELKTTPLQFRRGAFAATANP